MEKYLTIPSEIHNIDDLSLGERYILALIYNLSRGRPCSMSNKQMAINLNVTERTIIRIINRLMEKGYITINRPSVTKRLINVDLSPCQTVTMTNCHHDNMSVEPCQTVSSNHDKLSVEPCQTVSSNHDKLSYKNIINNNKKYNYNIGAAEGGEVVDNSFNTLMQDYREKVEARGGFVTESNIKRVKALYKAYGYELAYRAVFEVYIQDDLKNFDLMNKYCVDWQKEEEKEKEKEKDKGAAAHVG